MERPALFLAFLLLVALQSAFANVPSERAEENVGPGHVPSGNSLPAESVKDNLQPHNLEPTLGPQEENINTVPKQEITEKSPSSSSSNNPGPNSGGHGPPDNGFKNVDHGPNNRNNNIPNHGFNNVHNGPSNRIHHSSNNGVNQNLHTGSGSRFNGRHYSYYDYGNRHFGWGNNDRWSHGSSRGSSSGSQRPVSRNTDYNYDFDDYGDYYERPNSGAGRSSNYNSRNIYNTAGGNVASSHQRNGGFSYDTGFNGRNPAAKNEHTWDDHVGNTVNNGGGRGRSGASNGGSNYASHSGNQRVQGANTHSAPGNTWNNSGGKNDGGNHKGNGRSGGSHSTSAGHGSTGSANFHGSNNYRNQWDVNNYRNSWGSGNGGHSTGSFSYDRVGSNSNQIPGNEMMNANQGHSGNSNAGHSHDYHASNGRSNGGHSISPHNSDNLGESKATARGRSGNIGAQNNVRQSQNGAQPSGNNSPDHNQDESETTHKPPHTHHFVLLPNDEPHNNEEPNETPTSSNSTDSSPQTLKPKNDVNTDSVNHADANNHVPNRGVSQNSNKVLGNRFNERQFYDYDNRNFGRGNNNRWTHGSSRGSPSGSQRFGNRDADYNYDYDYYGDYSEKQHSSRNGVTGRQGHSHHDGNQDRGHSHSSHNDRTHSHSHNSGHGHGRSTHRVSSNIDHEENHHGSSHHGHYHHSGHSYSMHNDRIHNHGQHSHNSGQAHGRSNQRMSSNIGHEEHHRGRSYHGHSRPSHSG